MYRKGEPVAKWFLFYDEKKKKGNLYSVFPPLRLWVSFLLVRRRWKLGNLKNIFFSSARRFEMASLLLSSFTLYSIIAFSFFLFWGGCVCALLLYFFKEKRKSWAQYLFLGCCWELQEREKQVNPSAAAASSSLYSCQHVELVSICRWESDHLGLSSFFLYCPSFPEAFSYYFLWEFFFSILLKRLAFPHVLYDLGNMSVLIGIISTYETQTGAYHDIFPNAYSIGDCVIWYDVYTLRILYPSVV